MATTETTVTLDHARVNSFAVLIRGLVTPFAEANSDKNSAKDLAGAASKHEVSVRETIMVALADFSQVNQLTDAEVVAASAKVAAMHNDAETKKAMDTFVGECRSAMYPGVRARVPALLALRDLCWQSETEIVKADSTMPKPLRDAFIRQYHMLIAMFKAAKEGKVPLATPEDIRRFAEAVALAARTNVAKGVKRMERLVAALKEFHKDFPVMSVSECVRILEDVDATALRKTRGPALAVMPKAAPVVIPQEEPENGEGTADAGDILDDVLRAA